MRVDVALTPDLLPAAARDAQAVVIDVLRATSTIVCALSAGAAGVRPMAGLDEAQQLARRTGAVLGGEREGLAPPGYDLGNSPQSYDGAACAQRDVVLCTTNGTRAVAAIAAHAAGAAAGSQPARAGLLAASFLNVGVTARALVAGGADEVLLVCAGTRGRVAADDTAAAGCLSRLLAQTAGAVISDAALLAIALFEAWQENLPGLLAGCESGRRLARIALSADVAFCARVDAVPLVARLDEGGVFRSGS